MHKYFIAGIISASIAITTLSANPAAASDRQTTNLLAGLAGLAIFGAIIHDSNQKKKATSHVGRDTYAYQPRRGHHHFKRAPAHAYKPKRRAHRHGYRKGNRHYNRHPHH